MCQICFQSIYPTNISRHIRSKERRRKRKKWGRRRVVVLLIVVGVVVTIVLVVPIENVTKGVL